MQIFEQLMEALDGQFQKNRGKNLFYKGRERHFCVSARTGDFIKKRLGELLKKAGPGGRDDLVKALAGVLRQKALEQFSRANQYFEFTASDLAGLDQIYQRVIQRVIRLYESNRLDELDAVFARHHLALAGWLLGANPELGGLYSRKEPFIKEIVCAQYSAKFQLELLGIDPSGLMEPVLDLGCGKDAPLTRHLASLGLNVTGIDRLAAPEPGLLIQADWLEYPLKPCSLGTIISNMSFSNHLRHHHLRGSARMPEYEKRYFELLKALKPGGAFIYAPGLEFLEKRIDRAEYKVESSRVPGQDGLRGGALARVRVARRAL